MKYLVNLPLNAHGVQGINRKITLSVSIEIELTSGFTFTFRGLGGIYHIIYII